MDGYLPIKPGSPTFALQAQPVGVGASAFGSTLGATRPSVTHGLQTYFFDNSNNAAAAWIGYATDSAVAVTNCFAAVLGGMSPAFRIAGKTVQSLTLRGNMSLAAGLEMGSGTVYGAMGEGV